MEHQKARGELQDFSSLFDTIEFPDAYRLTFLAGSLAGPAYDEIKRNHGIIRAEYVLLVCLSHFDQLTAQDVANIARRPRNTVSRAVHKMVSEGYIQRVPDTEDGRQALLRITPSGRALHEKAAKYLKSRQEQVLSSLSAEERRVFSALLRKLALSLTERNE